MTTQAIPMSTNSRNRPSVSQLMAVPALVTMVILVIWFLLAKHPLVGSLTADTLRAIPTRWERLSMVTVGIWPWVFAVFALQLLWAAIPGLSGYFLADEKRSRSQGLRTVTIFSLVFLFIEASNIGGWLRGRADLAHLGAGYFGEILATLAMGFAVSMALAMALQRIGPGHGFGIMLLLMMLTHVAIRAHQHLPHLHNIHSIWTAVKIIFYVLVGAALVAFIVWAHDKKVELPPQTLETRNRELATVYVKFGFLGLLPFWIASVTLGVLRSTVQGLQIEYHLYGKWVSLLVKCLSPHTLVGTLILAALIWVGTYMAFRLLYPSHRLAKILGRQERDVADFFRPWLDSQLALYALYLIAILFVGKLFLSRPLGLLGMGPMSLLLIVATLLEVRDGFRHQVALESEQGPLATVTTAMGVIEAEILRTRLEREGVPAVLRPWTTQTVLPASVPGMGEIEILVPADQEARAREALR